MKNKWKYIYFSEDLIVYESEKSCKIRMPSGSDFNGFFLWYPSKLVKDVPCCDLREFIYLNSFEFVLKKYGKGVYNKRDVIEEKKVSAEEIEEALTQRDFRNLFDVHIPKKLTPEKVVVPEDLKDE